MAVKFGFWSTNPTCSRLLRLFLLTLYFLKVKMLLILKKLVSMCFQRNPKFDMAPLLGGTDVVHFSISYTCTLLVSFFPHHLLDTYALCIQILVLNQNLIKLFPRILLHLFMHTHVFPLPNSYECIALCAYWICVIYVSIRRIYIISKQRKIERICSGAGNIF